MDYGTSSYHQETPKWLWKPFTNGPADDHDRYNERITRLIALDVLLHSPRRLEDDEYRRARELAAEIGAEIEFESRSAAADGGGERR